MTTAGNTARITFVVKSEIKELIMYTAKKEDINLHQMYQILLIEALAARFRQKRATNNLY